MGRPSPLPASILVLLIGVILFYFAQGAYILGLVTTIPQLAPARWVLLIGQALLAGLALLRLGRGRPPKRPIAVVIIVASLSVGFGLSVLGLIEFQSVLRDLGVASKEQAQRIVVSS